MKSDSAFINHMTEKEKHDFVDVIVENTQHHLHVINDIIIFAFLNEVGIVNTLSKKLNFFEDEQTALNRVLDYYNTTKFKQTKLFE